MRDRTGRSTNVVVVGYASADYAMAVPTFHADAATTLVTGRLSAPWPAPGGLVHVLRAVVASGGGLAVEAVSWVAGDTAGLAWQAAVEQTGSGTSGVHVSGTRSPSAFLFYPQTGGTVCVYDPGDCHPGGLTATQGGVVAQADWCLVTVGPASATRAALEVLPPAAPLAWAVKNDRDAFSPDLVRALLGRASVVTFGAGERRFLHDALGSRDLAGCCQAGAVLVETQGAAGVRWHVVGRSGQASLGVRPVLGGDTTGAGDTLVGTLVARLALGSRREDAIRAAVEAATTHVDSPAPTSEPARHARHSEEKG